MRAILIIGFLLLTAFKQDVEVLRANKLEFTPKETNSRIKFESFCKEKYDETIEFIKFHEGFRSTPYNDCGWKCIGYGQRIKFFSNFEIGDSITRNQADSILRLSFDNHLRIVDKVYPGLNEFQRYSAAHMSYGIGIGTMLKAKYIYKTTEGWKLNRSALLTYREVDRTKKNYRDNRIFEYTLFNL